MDLTTYLASLRLSRDVIDVMLGGKSSIDTRAGTLPTKTYESTEKFIAAYGMNLNDPIQAAEILGVYHEAIRFIRKYFLRPENPEGVDLEIPRLFLELQDIRDLFVYSAEKHIETAERSNWSCAIIRVMHTIIHLDKDLREDYFPSIQKQIFDRFYKEIHNENGTIYLGSPKRAHPIELKYFQTKPRKARDSQILKLLHKVENVAEDIYDQVGVRFVTKSRMDCLRVLKFLRDHHIVIPGNLKPSRSRNSLLDPFFYRRIWREARFEVQRENLRSPSEVDAFIEQKIQEIPQNNQISPASPATPGNESKEAAKEARANLFTSDSYMAIQFTVRQLVKYRNPIYEDVKKLKLMLKENSDDEARKLAERLDISSLAKSQIFFYPYEVQIMDERAYQESLEGTASHSTYKAAQLQTAAHRILRGLIKKKS